MTANPGSEVVGDLARNLVRINYRGHVGVAEVRACGEAVEKLLPQLRPGFTVLTDLSGLDSMELDCAADISRMMDKFRAKGVGVAVRIIPDPTKDIGFNILAIVHYRRGVRVVTCRDAAEAERVLKPG
jgi:hypothetical protein